jgi:lipid-A-disaccharide synthase
VLPGSRHVEIHRLAKVFGEAIGRLAEKRGPIKVVLPTLREREEEIRAVVESWPIKPRIVVTEAEKHAAFRRARAALAASGTVTLELALAHVPMVVAYRVLPWEGLIVRAVVRVSSASLPNLVLGETVVPEFMQGDCTAEKLADGLALLLDDTPERRRQLEGFARLDQIFGTDDELPSARAARVTLEVIENKRKSMIEENRS